MTLLFMLPALLAHSFPVQDPCHIHLGQTTVLKQICVVEVETLHQEVCRREKISQG